MTTTPLPLWLDDEQFKAGLKRHPRLAKRLEEINEMIEKEEDEDYCYRLVVERSGILTKIVS